MRGVFVCEPAGFPARLMYKFGVQARLVHHGIDPVGQIHLEDPGIALIPRVDQYEVVG